jgi:hypothetical protein
MYLSFADHALGLVDEREHPKPIHDETELIYALAMSLGIEKHRTQRVEMALDVGLDGADPARLAAIASVLKSDRLRRMVDQAMPVLASRFEEIDEKGLPVTKPGIHARLAPPDRNERVQAYLWSRNREYLPQGWSIRHLSDNGDSFSESLDDMNLRLCAHVMGLFAIRKARLTSTLAFIVGFSAILWGVH